MNQPPKFEIDPRYLWREFVKRAGGNPKVADSAFTAIQKLYGEPDRAYHTLGHILGCVDLLREFFPERGPRPDWYNRVELALWMHDIIYDTHRKDNEKRSAHVLIGLAAFLDLDPKLAHAASFDVECTTHTLSWAHPPCPVPTQWVLDIDLASMGFSWERFSKDSDHIREEFSWAPEEPYRAKRKEILQTFLDRPRIYMTEECHARFEGQARDNLKKHIEQLG